MSGAPVPPSLPSGPRTCLTTLCAITLLGGVIMLLIGVLHGCGG